MADRSTVTQVVQLGMESTPGTPVAATRKLQSLDFEINPAVTMEHFRPAGFKYETVVAEQREWTDGTIKGSPLYTEIIYPLSSAVTQTTPVTILDTATDTTARKWVFESSTSAPDNPLTLTVEQGSSFRAHRFGFGILNDFGYKFTREKFDLSGKLIGQVLQDPFTLTSGTTTVPLIPMLASQVCVYIDSTSGGLGTTKLLRFFSGDYGLSNRFGAVWPVDCAQASYAGIVETVPKQQFKIILEADAQGMALLPIMRVGTTQFLRVESTGPNIYTNGAVVVNYKFTHDMAVKVADVDKFSDQGGVYAIGFTLEVVHDATWGKSSHIEVINKMTAL